MPESGAESGARGPGGRRRPDPDATEREQRADVERRRDELLARARGEPDDGGGVRLMGLGLQFVVSLLVCLFAGQWLDSKLGTRPWLLIAGVVIGASVGFYTMVRTAVQEQKRESDAAAKRRSGQRAGEPPSREGDG